MVHQFKNNGYNIVLDVCSGSVHVVDDLVYDIIEVFEGRSKEEVAAKLKEEGKEYKEEDIYSAYDDVQSLVDAEQLFTEDIFQTEILVLPFKPHKRVVILYSLKKCSPLIKTAFGDCTVKVDPTILLGGLRAENTEIGRVLDMTLDVVLEQQHEWFAENSGLKIV